MKTLICKKYCNFIQREYLVGQKYFVDFDANYLDEPLSCFVLIDGSTDSDLGLYFRTNLKRYLAGDNFPYLYDYFYTEQEYRKLKLQKINEI